MRRDFRAGGSDNITLLAIANRWPPKTWSSLLERALYQSQILHEAVEESEGNLKLIKNKSELIDFLVQKEANPTLVGTDKPRAIVGRDTANHLFWL